MNTQRGLGGGGPTAACEGQALHVPALGTPQAQDALLGQQVQADGVDALLVDHNKAIPTVAADLRGRAGLCWAPPVPELNTAPGVRQECSLPLGREQHWKPRRKLSKGRLRCRARV